MSEIEGTEPPAPTAGALPNAARSGRTCLAYMGARRRLCAASALALSAFFFAATAAAVSSNDIPPECGTRAAFDRELRQRLGDDAPVESVQVSITRAGGPAHLRVQIGSELRELDDESCSELMRAAVVIATAMLLHEPPASTPGAPPASASPPPSPVPSSERPRFAVGAGVGVNVGTLPPPVLTVDLEGKALWRRFGVGLSLRYLAPGETPSSQDKGVRLHAFGAGVNGIFRPAPAWEARLGFAAQRLTGTGLGADSPQTDAAWAAGPTLGIGFTALELAPFWAGLGAEGQLNLVRGHFEITNYSGEVYDVRWLSGSAFVRLGLVW